MSSVRATIESGSIGCIEVWFKCSLNIYFRGGSEDVTYFRGPRFVTDCGRREGGGVKVVKNSVTYFMDGPLLSVPVFVKNK